MFKCENMQSKLIQKYDKYNTQKLIKKAQELVNKYVRLRDANKGCVSCSSHKVEHASHYYSAGHYPSLRFNLDNIHGSCIRCNTYLHGNLIPYREELLNRIGIQKVEHLDNEVVRYKRYGFHLDRFALIEIIEDYKLKIKNYGRY